MLDFSMMPVIGAGSIWTKIPGMQTGWVLIMERWYFFNPVSDGTRGMMFIGRKTPDEYFVTEDGSWDGKTK